MQITVSWRHAVYAGTALSICAVGWVGGFIAGKGFWSQESAGWAQAVGTFVAIWASTLVTLAVRRAERADAISDARAHAMDAALRLVANVLVTEQAAEDAAANLDVPATWWLRELQERARRMGHIREDLRAANGPTIAPPELRAHLNLAYSYAEGMERALHELDDRPNEIDLRRIGSFADLARKAVDQALGVVGEEPLSLHL
ncbi:hypothetical protein [Phenylobacterium ferrooxidans]|uniref:Uncharacterized protein n=1 Tax=Phenylobacterium ferrooxidans TaxID=2982689 RepID=A0ABW6CML0_9CAUL